MTPLTLLVANSDGDHDSSAVHPDAAEANTAMRGWLDELTAALDRARRDIIQIRSEAKPLGLIDANWRTTTGVTLLDATFARIRSKVFETGGKYDFFPDIYALCWDLIERDLARVRRFFTRDFLRKYVTQLNDRFQELGREAQAMSVLDYNRAGSLLHSRIMAVSSWFIRPVFRKEVYKLRTLVESTFSIIRDLEPSGVFVETVAVPEDEEIDRGAFEVIGDVLFILIGNAVKHGSPDGEIAVSSAKSDEDPVTLAVRSHVTSSDDLDRASERISEAVRVSGTEVLANASVAEGFSGIRKIIGDIGKIRGGKVDLRFLVHENTNALEFVVTVPRRIFVARV